MYSSGSYYRSKRKKDRKYRRGIIAILFAVVIIVVFVFVRKYNYLTMSVIKTNDGGNVSLYIPTGSDFQDVKNILNDLGVLKNKNAFIWLAKRMNYDENKNHDDNNGKQNGNYTSSVFSVFFSFTSVI